MRVVVPDWYLYMIKCRDGALYTGISTDVDRRFAQHQTQGPPGSKYLKGRGPLTLVFQRKLGIKSLALKVEHRVKKMSKGQKNKVIGVRGYIEEIVSRVKGY